MKVRRHQFWPLVRSKHLPQVFSLSIGWTLEGTLGKKKKVYKVYKSIEKFIYHEVKLETFPNNTLSEAKLQHLVCFFTAAKKQAKEHCSGDPVNPNSAEAAKQTGLQHPCNFGNTGLNQVLLNLIVFPTTLIFPSNTSQENSSWSYSAPEIQGILLKVKTVRVSPGSSTELPRRNWALAQEFSNTKG